MERANAAGALAVTKVGPMEGNSSSGDARRLSGETLMTARRRLAIDHRRQSRRQAARHRLLVHGASADAERDARRPSRRRRPDPDRGHLQPGESARRLHRHDARRLPDLHRRPGPPGRRRLRRGSSWAATISGRIPGRADRRAKPCAKRATWCAPMSKPASPRFISTPACACADDRELVGGDDRRTRRRRSAPSPRRRAPAATSSMSIGTEVPIPGGETEALDSLAVTPPEAARRTFELHRAAFAREGIGEAMGNVIALVVQPGVDMGNTQVFGYDKAKAAALSAAVLDIPGVVFEAHSTDFQTEAALAEPRRDAFRHPESRPFADLRLSRSRRRHGGDRGAARRIRAFRRARRPGAGDGRQPRPLARLCRRGRRRATRQALRPQRPRSLLLARPARRGRGQDADAQHRRRVRPAGTGRRSSSATCFWTAKGALSRRIIQAKVGAVVARYRRASGSLAIASSPTGN